MLNPGRCFHMPNNKSVITTGASRWLSSALTAPQKEQNPRGRKKRCSIRWKNHRQLEKRLINDFNPEFFFSFFIQGNTYGVILLCFIMGDRVGFMVLTDSDSNFASSTPVVFCVLKCPITVWLIKKPFRIQWAMQTELWIDSMKKFIHSKICHC